MVKKIAMGSIAVTRARKGKDADYYEIVTDTDNFHLNNEGKWDNSMLVQYVHVVGATRTSVAGAIKINFFDKSTNKTPTFTTLQVPEQGLTLSSTMSVMPVAYLQVFTMLVESKAIIILSDNASKASDRTLSVVADGTNGTSISSANVFFCVSDSNTEQPDDSSFTNDTAKALFTKANGSKYLWQATKITYSDNKSAVTGKICLGLIDDMQSSTEMYTNTDSAIATPIVPGNTGAASWTSTPQPQKGKYLWETTKITYANDTDNAKYTAPICVGVFGDDGDAGETPTISTSVLYSSSTKSATQPADGTFTLTKVPALSKGDYLWCKETTTYTYTKNKSLTKSTTRYWVSRIGDDGATGKGIHVAYATDANGKDFSTTWFAAATYIGIYVGSEENDPTDPKKYDWSRIKGEQGDPGIQGLILRDSIWQEGVDYHNDKDVKTDGIRYLDYVYLKKTTGSGYCVFVCNKTHTSSSSNKPTTKIITNSNTQDEVAVSQGNWTAVNDMGPLYTPLLIAENADFQFGQTNRLLIMNSKNQVQGCFGGVEDETNGYPLWIGGATADAAKFRVKFDGSAEMQGLKATQADISGKITAEEGVIGGFTIAGNGLTNINNNTVGSNYNFSYIICRNDYFNRFAGIGANVLPASSATFSAVARFENNDNKGWMDYDIFGKVNIAAILEASGGKYNYAFYGKGDGILNGDIIGYKFQEIVLIQNQITDIDISKGIRVLFNNNVSNAGLGLPRISSLRQALGLASNSTTQFAIPMYLMQGYGSTTANVIYGKNNSVYSTIKSSNSGFYYSSNPSRVYSTLQIIESDGVKATLKISGGKVQKTRSGTTTTYNIGTDFSHFFMNDSEYPIVYDNDKNQLKAVRMGKGDCLCLMLVYDGREYGAYYINQNW